MALTQKQLQQLPAVVDQFTIQSSKREIEIEIDCLPDGDFGDLYRVWKDDKFLGSFHELPDGWKAFYYDSDRASFCDTEAKAQKLIIENYLTNLI